MTSSNNAAPQVAVWYFIGATFLFVAPILFVTDAPLWVRILSLVLGGIAMIIGGVKLAREISQRGDGGDAPRGDDSPDS